MSTAPTIGDEAPNFDLSSTEGVLLMLRDEVPRRTVVLYFFADPSDSRVRRDLEELSRQQSALDKLHASVLGISPVALKELGEAQRELSLRFPLLRDDRDFSARYGVVATSESQPASPALVVVSRKQRILWMSNPVTGVADALPQLLQVLKGQPSPTGNYPKSVISRFIDRWVN